MDSGKAHGRRSSGVSWKDQVAGKSPSVPLQEDTPISESDDASPGADAPTNAAAGGQLTRRAAAGGHSIRRAAAGLEPPAEAPSPPRGISPLSARETSPGSRKARSPAKSSSSGLSLSLSLGQLPPAWKGGGQGTTPGTPRSANRRKSNDRKPVQKTGPAAAQLAAVKVRFGVQVYVFGVGGM